MSEAPSSPVPGKTTQRRKRLRGGLVAIGFILAIGVVTGFILLRDDGAKPIAPQQQVAVDRQLAPVHEYLDEHIQRLDAATGDLVEASTRYADLVAAHDGDYAAVASGDRADEARTVLNDARAAWRAANPAYEEAEGIVAGVPSLAEFDVMLDAGTAAADDAEGAVPFDIKVSDDRVLKRPGNYFLVTEATLWGTEPDWSSGVAFDIDGDGSTKQVGDMLPDALVLQAASRDFHATVGDLRKASERWSPTESDVYTALVVMIPTMNEYFDSWAASQFIAGETSTERGFVSYSRLADVVDILEGLQVIEASVHESISAKDAALATKIKQDLDALVTYVTEIRDREASGTRFTTQQAHAFGAEAQERATGISAAVQRAANQTGVAIQS